MISGMPISWLTVEIFSLILFFTCIAHASRQENPGTRILEFFGFVIGAAIFENIGVYVVHTYVYDVRRIMMIGGVPLEILLIEAAIWYAAFNLVQYLNLPAWAKPFAVGLFGSVQDMTIDPAACFDRYAIADLDLANRINASHPGALGNGILSGQWNWTNPGYDQMFFGIPFYNFSGWMYLMFWFTALVLLGRWLYQRYQNGFFAYGFPILSGVLNAVIIATPITSLLLFASFFSMGSRTSQIVMLCINFGFAIVLLFIFRNRLKPIELKKDKIVFVFPIIIHLFDVIYAFALGIKIAYVPVTVVTIIHLVYLFYVFSKSRKLASA